MKKVLFFGLLAAGAAVAAAAIYKAKSKNYVCDADYTEDECDDCCCDCGEECCGDACDIPAEKADEACVQGESSVQHKEANSDVDSEDEPTGI